ncbi:MAG: hypothetical protein IIX27_02935 [Ruminococcus sp.]|nr:hypothetical protein [Ruminococcus sp.]
MKNTTFRKKALLSSVAMLLVALVALGSATFAWFAANPNAEASGLNLKTTAASGLVIKTDTDPNWSHNALLDAIDDPNDEGTKVIANTVVRDLQPVSQNQATAANFVTVEARESGNYAWKDGSVEGETAATIGGAQSTAYYSEKVFFKLSTGSAAEPTAKVQLTNVAITPVDGAVLQNAIRVAIADASGKVIGTYALNTTKANGVLGSTGTVTEFTNLDTVGAKTPIEALRRN